MSRNIVVFDLETQRGFNEVGGESGLALMGVSVGVTYSYQDNRFRHYFEHELDRLVEELRRSDLVVGFNVRRFDYHVLQPYTDFPLHTLLTLDILEHVHRALGFRVKLDVLAQYTLGIGKGGNGLLALRWWRTGQLPVGLVEGLLPARCGDHAPPLRVRPRQPIPGVLGRPLEPTGKSVRHVVAP